MFVLLMNKSVRVIFLLGLPEPMATETVWCKNSDNLPLDIPSHLPHFNSGIQCDELAIQLDMTERKYAMRLTVPPNAALLLLCLQCYQG